MTSIITMGMLLCPEPLFAVVREREAVHSEAGRAVRRVLLTPQGKPFSQSRARDLAEHDEALLLICGRYEGFDERIRQGLVDEEISLGDFVSLGGEATCPHRRIVRIEPLPGLLDRVGE